MSQMSQLYLNLNTIPNTSNDKDCRFTFIDLFAGIGGFHIAMDNLGGECVFASEWDKDCRKTYTLNFKETSKNLFNEDGTPTCNFVGDITKIKPEDIPDHDILCAGFPCQPFSQAGLKKGFEDTRGTLFFNIASILKAKQPKAFFLENVRGLLNHDNGKTFTVIQNTLNELNYNICFKIVKASDFNCPQHRPRLFIIGIKKTYNISYEFPEPIPLTKSMSDVFDGAVVNKQIGFTLRLGGKHSKITDKRNWDGYIVNGVERRITSKEGKRMQGFPEDYQFPVSETIAMKQLGNSVAIPAIQAVGNKLIETLEHNKIL